MNYISDIGKLIKKLDKKPSSYSKSRLQEEAKYKRIHQLRDGKDKNDKNN